MLRSQTVPYLHLMNGVNTLTVCIWYSAWGSTSSYGEMATIRRSRRLCELSSPSHRIPPSPTIGAIDAINAIGAIGAIDIDIVSPASQADI